MLILILICFYSCYYGYVCVVSISKLLLIFIFNCYLLTYFVYLNPQKIAKKESLLRVRFVVLFRTLGTN